MNTSKATLLIVDDTPENLQILTDHLKQDYRVLAANSGKKALNTAKKAHPDLILLDIMMPEMDGYEVCKRLKADPEMSNIPVVFVTALSNDQDEFKGLNLGAVDYISKPFNPSILKSRVQTQIELQLAKKELVQHNFHLEDLVRQRSQELAEAHDRLKVLDAAKQDFLSAISHELRTPVNGVLGLADLAYSSLGEYEKDTELYEAFQDSSARLLRTMDDALLLTELQTKDNYIKDENLDIQFLCEAAIRDVVSMANKRNIEINFSQLNSCQVKANHQLIHNALITMLQAAIKLGNEAGVIRLTGETIDKHNRLNIRFSGIQLSEATIDSFFEIFSEQRSSSYVEELGLSIPVAYRVIEALGGRLRIQNTGADSIEIQMDLLKA